MYVEKRKSGKDIKYYLVHSYREKNKVKKIRKYLGRNLNKEQLEEAEKKAEKRILKLLEEISTEVFLFTLTKKQVEQLNRCDDRIKIFHLNEKEWRKFTEEFVYDTNAIEGSTVQREEVQAILRKPKAADAEELETKGVAKAVGYIKRTKEGLSIGLIKKLHKLCFDGSKSFAGQIRNVEVVIKNSEGDIIHRGVPASRLKLALEDMISWYKENKYKFKPLVLAAIIHGQFEHIHPFQDGNGRVGRLLLNFILLKNNYPPINITLEDRAEYYKTLREYSKNQNIKSTVRFLIKQYKKTLRKVTTKAKNNEM